MTIFDRRARWSGIALAAGSLAILLSGCVHDGEGAVPVFGGASYPAYDTAPRDLGRDQVLIEGDHHARAR